MPFSIVLKPDREESVLKGHPWIFSGAISTIPPNPKGSILPIKDSKGKLLGHGFFHTQPKTIWGRVLSLGEEPPLKAVERHLDLAVSMRQRLIKKNGCNAYRLVNGEGDRLPGLVVDQYDNVLVIQFHCLGMEKLKDFILNWLISRLNPIAIVEKSEGPSRKEEGLDDRAGILFGELPNPLLVQEGGYTFQINPLMGQKTGFFLDQRELRAWVGSQSEGRRVLNTFSYTGGFSIYALKGGAKKVESVDRSSFALENLQTNLALNGLKHAQHESFEEDAFLFLTNRPLPYDLIILDPPALIKKKAHFQAGCRAYFELNRKVLEKIEPDSIFVSCSCSYFLEEGLLQKIIFDASRKAQREISLIHKHSVQPDHPIHLAMENSGYLKGLCFRVL